MRGTQIFNDIFDGDHNRPLRKGRDSALLQKRNRCIAHRYYYYGQYTDKRFDLILEQLHEEFYVSVNTISAVIKDNVVLLRELKQKKPSIIYFQTRWPHLKW